MKPWPAPLAACCLLAEAAGDGPTADLLNARLQIHEKTAWMLRALLES